MSDKIVGTEEAWESRVLGAEEAFVEAVSKKEEQDVDASIGLQMISIRLDRDLIEKVKLIADFHGVGYQPLMRDALQRFADSELRNIVERAVRSQREQRSNARVRRNAATVNEKKKSAAVKKAAHEKEAA